MAASDIVTAIDAHILARLTDGAVDSYSINGRSLAKCTMSQLRELREYYANIDAADDRGSNVTYAKFVRQT